jgi:N-acetylmuramoyl-L-alanine amidase
MDRLGALPYARSVMRSTPHVVRSGEHLTGIASQFGTTVAVIWDDPANASLRRRRPNPEILAPGDVVYIPQTERKWLPVQIGTENRFVGTPLRVTVKVVLLGQDRKPLANRFLTAVPPSDTPLMTDGSGLLVCSVDVALKILEVTVDGANVRFQIRVGHLDPIDTDTGLASRLRHLGHGGDEEEHVMARDWLSGSAAELRAHALARSVASFQRTNGQPGDGQVDDALRRAVHDAHGC